jgi:predicted Zn-ribbon and HTH transcriptional regulator
MTQTQQAEEVVIKPCECVRCEHIWIPRKHGKPRECPRCQSPRWDEAKEAGR